MKISNRSRCYRERHKIDHGRSIRFRIRPNESTANQPKISEIDLGIRFHLVGEWEWHWDGIYGAIDILNREQSSARSTFTRFNSFGAARFHYQILIVRVTHAAARKLTEQLNHRYSSWLSVWIRIAENCSANNFDWIIIIIVWSNRAARADRQNVSCARLHKNNEQRNHLQNVRMTREKEFKTLFSHLHNWPLNKRTISTTRIKVVLAGSIAMCASASMCMSNMLAINSHSLLRCCFASMYTYSQVTNWQIPTHESHFPLVKMRERKERTKSNWIINHLHREFTIFVYPIVLCFTRITFVLFCTFYHHRHSHRRLLHFTPPLSVCVHRDADGDVCILSVRIRNCRAVVIQNFNLANTNLTQQISFGPEFSQFPLQMFTVEIQDPSDVDGQKIRVKRKGWEIVQWNVKLVDFRAKRNKMKLFRRMNRQANCSFVLNLP